MAPVTEPHEQEKEHSVRDWLDSIKLIAVVGIGFSILLAIWSIKLTYDTHSLAVTNRQLVIDTRQVVQRNQDLAKAVAVEQRKRRKAEIAANRNQVQTCFERNAQAPGLRALLEAIQPVVRASPKANEAIENYLALTRENVPSHSACVTLAQNLGIATP
jgi:hypothetical protein